MTPTKRPRIFYGAALLAALSLIWSAYAITDLMASGPYGLSVALAGDIGWITVLWAEAEGVTIVGRRWPAVLAGWLIAAGVSALLVLHGAEHSRAQAIAGPFVVLVGKAVWMFALAAMRDRTELTPEQQAEIDAVIRDSSHAAQVNKARSDAEIARIREQARVTLARDQADFEVWLERVRKRSELERLTPLAITASSEQPGSERAAEQGIGMIGEQPPSTPSRLANEPSEQPTNSPLNRENAAPEKPIIADLVREQIASTTNNTDAINNVMALRPDANRDSVAATVRRERRKAEKKAGPYL